MSVSAQEAEEAAPADQAEAAPAQDATLFPIPDYSAGLLSRPVLTGDWSGDRMTFAQSNGLQVVFNVNEYFQGIADGGYKNEGVWEDSGSADLRIQFDSGKSGLWPGGFIEIHAESYWGEKAALADGGVVPSNFDLALPAGAGTGTYMSHWTFTQFLNERFAVTMGKVDTSLGDMNDYAWGVGDQQFMNGSFNLNPVTYLSSPYSTLGGGVIALLGDEKEHLFSMLVYDGDGTIDESGTDTILKDRTTVGTALRLRTDFFEKKGHQYFGFLYGFGKDKYSSQLDDQGGQLILPPGPGISLPGQETEDNHWAFFYNFDQQLLSNPNNPGQDIGIFGRFGAADKDTSVIRTFWSLGLGGHGLIPSRTQDQFGVGYYLMRFNGDRIELIIPDNNEQGVEVYYNLAVTPWFELSADVQFIDGGLFDSDDAIVGALRGRLTF
jgi:porin